MVNKDLAVSTIFHKARHGLAATELSKKKIDSTTNCCHFWLAGAFASTGHILQRLLILAKGQLRPTLLAHRHNWPHNFKKRLGFEHKRKVKALSLI